LRGQIITPGAMMMISPSVRSASPVKAERHCPLLASSTSFPVTSALAPSQALHHRRASWKRPTRRHRVLGAGAHRGFREPQHCSAHLRQGARLHRRS
jgi:hypothetical protein